MTKLYKLLAVVALITCYCCEDVSELVYKAIPVVVNISSSPSDFESLKVDIEEIRIISQKNDTFSVSSEFAGVHEVTMWEVDKFMLADFLVTYDSVSQIEITFGPENSVQMSGGDALPLSFLNDNSRMVNIPVDLYIQDLTQANIELEIKTNESVVPLTTSGYAFDPQAILKN